MEPSEAPLSSLPKGLEVIRKKRKICKKNLEENIENIISVLQNTVEQISSVTEFEVGCFVKLFKSVRMKAVH
jgi:hypothetical protein